MEVQASSLKPPSLQLLLILWLTGTCLSDVGSSVNTISFLPWGVFYTKPFVPQLPTAQSCLFPWFGALCFLRSWWCHPTPGSAHRGWMLLIHKSLGVDLWPHVLFLVCLPWGRVMEIALWPTLQPLQLYIDVYLSYFHNCRVKGHLTKPERRWWLAWKLSANVPSCSAGLSHPAVFCSSPLLTCPSWPRQGHNPLCCSRTSPSQARRKYLTTALATPFVTSWCESPEARAASFLYGNWCLLFSAWQSLTLPPPTTSPLHKVPFLAPTTLLLPTFSPCCLQTSGKAVAAGDTLGPHWPKSLKHWHKNKTNTKFTKILRGTTNSSW